MTDFLLFSRYRFLQILKLHSTLIKKKDFCHKSSFFDGFSNPPSPTPFNGQNLLNVTNVFGDTPLKYLIGGNLRSI